MNLIDSRIPVMLRLTPAQAGDAWLMEGASQSAAAIIERFALHSSPAHAAGCACCGAPTTAAAALRRLFLRRARGEVPLFDRVLVRASPPGQAAIVAALNEDVVVAGRYRQQS